jgi:hypothetical protein
MKTMTEKKAETHRLPYRLREPFLTTTELALFRALAQMVGARYFICPKVSLDDVFYIVRPNENVHFFNKIFRKHVDFLLCDPQTLAPAFAVEIVRSPSRGQAREQDKFMDELFTGAGLPLVHIPSSEHYESADLVALFQFALTKIGGTDSLRIERPGDSVPQCPVCGKMMVLRMHRNGPSSGKKYYGCMDSPHCNGVVPLD